MSDHIVIERLEFRSRCGVTDEERARPQPLAIDLELDGPPERAGLSDNLGHTIDYAKVVKRVVEVGTTQDSCLIEAIAERILSLLYNEFPIDRAKIWVRKLHPPIPYVAGSVGVTVERTRLEQQLRHTDPSPAPFLVQQMSRLPKGRALDVAAGSGRHSLFLAAQGYQVDAIDRDKMALSQLSTMARTRRLSTIATRSIDLEQPPPFEPGLGTDTYDVIVVFFYLHRSLFPFLIEALKPGGALVYETFTIDNYFHNKHPKRWEFCLAYNELLRLTSSLQVLHYDEGSHVDSGTSKPLYTAQLTAYKPLHGRPST